MKHIVWVLFLVYSRAEPPEDLSEEGAKSYLDYVNKKLADSQYEVSLAKWQVDSNLTDYNRANALNASSKGAQLAKELWLQTIKYPWQNYTDPVVRRQFEKLSVLGASILPEEKYKELTQIKGRMQSTYAEAKICDFKNAKKCDLNLEPEITEILSNSQDPEELKHVWVEWRKASGGKIRNDYTKYVDLLNEAARLNNFTNNAEMWLVDFEDNQFRDQIEELWEQVKPLYLQLHAYVRRRLNEKYGDSVVSRKEPIPAHLLGNMWAQTWNNILSFTKPFPNKTELDVTQHLVSQNYTAVTMFKLAEKFFTSLGLEPMPESFWKYSILEKPKDGRQLICHASAWDFYNGKDFRIKQCTRITYDSLITAHHEMGHVQYYLQYKHLPVKFRRGANSGFHEAVGDTIALSVNTPQHLKQIGLLPEIVDDLENDINQQFSVALSKIAFLPFGYLIDQYRWAIFRGDITSDRYNSEWWKLREKYQGVTPPVRRTEEDFDAGAKYHVAAGVPYIRYFVSNILQFQFHKALCKAAGQYGDGKPLHKCDIYGSKEAGKIFGDMLKLGSSKPWPDALELITGERKMNANALVEFFEPLKKWLEQENKRTGEAIGWTTNTEKKYDSTNQQQQ